MKYKTPKLMKPGFFISPSLLSMMGSGLILLTFAACKVGKLSNVTAQLNPYKYHRLNFKFKIIEGIKFDRK